MHLRIDYTPVKVCWEFIHSEAVEGEEEGLGVLSEEVMGGWAANEVQL